MVREALAKRTHQDEPARVGVEGFRTHSSHRLLPLPSGGDNDGLCLIEPSVRCVHCGYCQSYGH
jgi:hypothetical protein